MPPISLLIHRFFDKIRVFDYMAIFFISRARRRRILTYRQNLNIHPTAELGDVFLDRNVSIGEGTYFNSGQVFAGENSSVKIGRFCTIAYNVHIKARSHDPRKSTRTSLSDSHLRREADVFIGDYVWIGDNVFVREGVTIGDRSIIGANSVVTKDIPADAVVGGVPARIIRSQPSTPYSAGGNGGL